MNAWSRPRRRFLPRFAALGVTAATADRFFTPGAFAAELTRTPPQTEGPFYPDKLPLDTDNDLLIVNANLTPALRKSLISPAEFSTSTASPSAAPP